MEPHEHITKRALEAHANGLQNQADNAKARIEAFERVCRALKVVGDFGGRHDPKASLVLTMNACGGDTLTFNRSGLIPETVPALNLYWCCVVRDALLAEKKRIEATLDTPTSHPEREETT